MEERRINCYRHSGPGYHEDNRTFYNVLVQFFSGSSCEDIIRRYQTSGNGKSAWRDVKNHLEGQDYKLQLVREANSMLEKANFSGNARYGFEDYYKTHVRAHLMLLEGDQPKSELEKITTFMSKITDQGILADYKSNRNDPLLRDNFQALYNHLAEGHRFDHPDGVPARITRKSNKRTINQVTGRGYAIRGGRGRGRFGGRGRGRGRDGRGRGRGGNNYGQSTSNEGTLPPEVVSNPHQEFDTAKWNSFSYQQRQAIHLLRRNMPRQIASMERNETKTESSGTSNNDVKGNSSTAGSAMGSRPSGRK